MKEKDKAKELVDKFYDTDEMSESAAKQCAFICINELMKQLEDLHKPEYTSFRISEDEILDGYELIDYWQRVKIELEEL